MMEVTNSSAFTFPKKAEVPPVEPAVAAKAVSAQAQQKQHDEPVTKEKLIEKVESMNDFLEPTATSVKFHFHEELGEYYVQVIDAVTDEVIREIPNKKFLDLYASMAEFAGLFVDEKR